MTATPPGAAAPQRPAIGGLGVAGRRVLVVEDDYIQAYNTVEWLEGAGVEVVGPAGDALEAERLIDSEAIDVAMVDLNLRDGDTLSVVEALKRQDIPFLIVSGYDGAAIPAVLSRAARLQKPVTEEQVAAALAGVLAGRAA